jgi:transcriptional regulator with XRE-family HTH domain
MKMFPEDMEDDIFKEYAQKADLIQDKVNYRMKLAAKIFHGMRAKGWQQKEFAEVVDKTPSTISKWLSGTHNFETDTLFEIEKVLGIKLLNIDRPNTPFRYQIEFNVANVIERTQDDFSSYIQDSGGLCVFNIEELKLK